MSEGYRLSPQQKRLWLLHQGSVCAAYRVERQFCIEGSLNVELLTAALGELLRKHEILRTTFAASGDPATPMQLIGDLITPSINYHDLSGQDPLEQQSAAEALFTRVRQAKYDLSTGPALRVTLLKLSPRKHLLLVMLPALCSDDRSLSNLVSEIGHTYETLIRNEESDVAELQYADIAEAMNQILESDETDLGRNYWCRQDFSVLAGLKIPFERTAMPVTVFAPRSAAVRIPSAKISRIGQLTTSLGTTPEVFLLACWQALFWRLTGQSDVITGRLYDGRTSEELAETLGIFGRYMPVDVRIEANLRFDDVLRLATRRVTELIKWQEYFTWEQVKGATPNGQEPPFLPVCFDFEQGADSFSFDGISLQMRSRYACIDRFKLKLSCFWNDDSLICEFHYDPSCLFASDARRLANYYEALLDGVCETPFAVVADLEFMPECERHQALVEFSGREKDAPITGLFHEEFERQVGRDPDRIAVLFEEHHLSYAELNGRANRLARYLAGLGVGPEDFVAFCLNPSREMVIALLGVLKAGAAYLPLDPTLPASRLAFLLNDAKVSVLLTCGDGLAESVNYDGRTVHLETDWETVATCSEDNPHVAVSGDNVAYAIYTSGSTGRPKGVLVNCKGLSNLPIVQVEAFDVQPESRVLQFASIGFDASISEVAMALIRSATLCLATREAMMPGPSLIGLMKERSITTVTLPPSVLAALRDENLPALKTIITAGEACPADVVTRWAPGRRFCNGYGPTEATVCATIAESLSAHDSPSIGRPMTNVKVYVLDAECQPVPAGVAGELFIGGVGLARGYLSQPELTAERWVPNPFGPDLGSRLYKSGDWARWLRDGKIEFLGRIDLQVKIRGFRVELGEIEAALGEHSDLEMAVVLAQGDDTAGIRLIAYVVPKQKGVLSVSILRRFLQERLPAHLIPSLFVQVNELPLTKNGKVDRQALAKMRERGSQSETVYVAPAKRIERLIAGVWQVVIGVQRVGVNDNFFDLGGDSLMMVRIHSELEWLLKRELSMIDLFERPTVSALAQYLSRDTIEEVQAEGDDWVEKRKQGRRRLQQQFRQRREAEQEIGGQL